MIRKGVRGAGYFARTNDVMSIPLIVRAGGPARDTATALGYKPITSEQLSIAWEKGSMSALVHPDIYPMINRLFSSRSTDTISRVADTVSAANKQMRVKGSLFHMGAILESGAAAHGAAPWHWMGAWRRGLKKVNDPEMIADPIEHGLGSAPLGMDDAY